MTALLPFFSLVVFTFSVPAFTVLVFFYWRHGHRGSVVMSLFALACAAAFLANLASLVFFIDGQWFVVARSVVVGLLAPMMAHLVLEQEEPGLRWRPVWRAFLWLLYAAAVLSAFYDETAGNGALENSSQIILGTASVFAAALLITSRKSHSRGEFRQLAWNLVLFTLLLWCAAATFGNESPVLRIAPDYLLLLFFAVRLYYMERLAFFDVFLKCGSFVAVGALLLTVVLLLLPVSRNALAGDWIRTWLAALALLPVWLLGPLVFHHLCRWIDRAMDRKFSPVEAERLFMQRAPSAANPGHLRQLARECLGEIFHCQVEVGFGEEMPSAGVDDLVCPIAAGGEIRLMPRGNQVPFLSGDRRLLETLSATLSVLLQNVRLRAQQQELASLASRAELRLLRAQINPHFLFNALNAIAGLIRIRPELADDTVAQLADVFRYTLNRSQNEWVRVEEELDFVRSYLAVERARFGDRLEVSIAVDPKAAAVNIPAMVIQPLVENAIKHGTCQVARVGRVAITIVMNGRGLRVEVSDNGPGFPQGFVLNSPRDGHGLRNVSDRLRGYYGDGGVLRCHNTVVGSCVSVELEARL